MTGSLDIPGRSVALRSWRLDDLDVYEGWLQPEHEWHKLDGPYYEKPDRDEIREIIARRRAEVLDPGLPYSRGGLVISSGDDGDMIGTVSRYWESKETNWLCVGLVVFDPGLWGRGIGFEALGLWSDHLFGEIPELARLDLRTWSGNTGMMRLAQKLGYIEEARFRDARIVEGRYYDGMGYGVLREEWRSLYPDGFAAILGEDHTTQR